ncbi:hypothetical protein HK096_007444, partial [Nowakowskiella sp. JEL0078]
MTFNIHSRLLQWNYGLTDPPTRNVSTENFKIKMRDGVELDSIRMFPKDIPQASLPTILCRSPYGMSSVSWTYGTIFAERGYQVVIQNCRGTHGSGGPSVQFVPYEYEGVDGVDTVLWIQQQSWFNGKLATYGMSYMAYTQYATLTSDEFFMTGKQHPISASCITVGTSNMKYNMAESIDLDAPNAKIGPDGPLGSVLGLQRLVMWMGTIYYQERGLWKMVSFLAEAQAKKLSERNKNILNSVPIIDIDKKITDEECSWYRAMITKGLKDKEYMKKGILTNRVPELQVPFSMVAGWYDIFLPAQLNDYKLLQKVARDRPTNNGKLTVPYLLVGPWEHTNSEMLSTSLKQSILWLNAQLKGDLSGLQEKPVRLFVTGIREWKDFDEYPPKAYKPRQWFLNVDFKLTDSQPTETDAKDQYTYNPENPTPSVGGSLLYGTIGSVNQSELESRDDVLVYSSAPLAVDLEVIGEGFVELHVESTVQHTDFFVRVCQVDQTGISINISDGIVRLQASRNKVRRIKVGLSPFAHCFRKGCKIRLQVSSSAHPRFGRNHGTGADMATDTEFKISEQTVYRNSMHLSHLELP